MLRITKSLLSPFKFFLVSHFGYFSTFNALLNDLNIVAKLENLLNWFSYVVKDLTKQFVCFLQDLGLLLKSVTPNFLTKLFNMWLKLFLTWGIRVFLFVRVWCNKFWLRYPEICLLYHLIKSKLVKRRLECQILVLFLYKERARTFIESWSRLTQHIQHAVNVFLSNLNHESSYKNNY